MIVFAKVCVHVPKEVRVCRREFEIEAVYRCGAVHSYRLESEIEAVYSFCSTSDCIRMQVVTWLWRDVRFDLWLFQRIESWGGERRTSASTTNVEEEEASFHSWIRRCEMSIGRTRTHTHQYTHIHTHAHACTHTQTGRIDTKKNVEYDGKKDK